MVTKVATLEIQVMVVVVDSEVDLEAEEVVSEEEEEEVMVVETLTEQEEVVIKVLEE